MQNELPPNAKLEILEDGKWMTVNTRASTRAGMIRVYNALCRQNPHGAPYGMRIVTIHEEILGRVTMRGPGWKPNVEALPAEWREGL
jgi:hypothetical protein